MPRPSPHLLVRMWAAWRRRGPIRRLLTLLPRRLRQDYGHTGPYLPAQVEATIARYRICPPRFAPYAVAAFCDAETLNRLRREYPNGPNYSSLRQEVGGVVFDGDANFSLRDVMRHGESDGHHGDGGAGSGHDVAHHGDGGHH